MCGSTVSTRADSRKDRWQKAGLQPSKSRACSSAPRGCVERAAALPSAPSMQGLFPGGRCASGHPGAARPGWHASPELCQASRAQSSPGTTRSVQAPLPPRVFLCFTRRKEKTRRREERSLAGKQRKEPDGNSMVAMEDISLLGVSKARLVQHK